jgi:hypothetical protein
MIAYLDESSRQGPNGLCYVVAAAVVAEDEDRARDRLLKLRQPGQRFLHWHDEQRDRRTTVIEGVSETGVLVLVTVCHPVGNRRQERARQRCLVALAADLASEGVSKLVIESRQPRRDRRDRSTLLGAQQSGIARELVYRHTDKCSEPLLWAADAIAGAVSLHYAGRDSTYFTMLDTDLLRVRRLSP